MSPLCFDLGSPQLETSLTEGLDRLQLKLSDSRKLAESVLRLSDYYIQHPEEETPWEYPWAQAAYLVYFHPLNLARNYLVTQRGKTVGFFEGLTSAIDFGAGMGSASLALKELTAISDFSLIEKSSIPSTLIKTPWASSAHFKKEHLVQSQKTLAVFSYSLTEAKASETQWPSWASQCEALMILEPSTSRDGRQLLQLREKLIAQGFSLWAPCLHQEACPLLTHSKTDWCHDRLHLIAPNWFKEIEKHLPFKNSTITTSYLLARKTPAPLRETTIRLVGDHLHEKGKSRQMICRGTHREFLSWLHRQGQAPVYPRGELLPMPKATLKGDELRVDLLSD